MKLILKILAVLVVLLLVAVLTVPLWINPVAKTAVEEGGSMALGVPTTLGSISLGLFSGTAELASLNIANPQGFETPHFMNLGSGAVAINLRSIQGDTVEIPRFEIDGLDLYLEKGANGANYKKIIENLEKFSGDGKKGEPRPGEKKDEPGKKFVIREIIIRNVNVTAKTPIATIPLKVEELRMQNVGSEGEGVDMPKLIALIVSGVLKGVAEQGIGVLPDDISGGLKEGLASLKGLGTLGEDAAKAIEKAGGQSSEEIDKAAEKVKNLFGD